ncbi:MAG: hypothetical protein PHP00_00245 [Thiotrichaceae bacterium]|nr:hypothetical protein [Thiotrichaceae bacterium]
MDEINQKPSQEALLAVYNAQWADIHHNRNQAWELCKLVIGGVIAISGLTAFTHAKLLISMLSVLFIIVGIMAILITIRHKVLFSEKMSAIRKLESALYVDHINGSPLFMPQTSSSLGLLHVQTILIAICTLSTFIFVVFLFLQMMA